MDVDVALLGEVETAGEVRAIAARSRPSVLSAFFLNFLALSSSSWVKALLDLWAAGLLSSRGSDWELRVSEDSSLAASSNSCSSSSIAPNSRSCSSVMLPQLCIPAPFLRRDLSRPVLDSERSFMRARGKEEREVRVMMYRRGGTRRVEVRRRWGASYFEAYAVGFSGKAESRMDLVTVGAYIGPQFEGPPL